jgi:predicted thioredoxin/glutaredoxin
MARVVDSVIPSFGEAVTYDKIVTKQLAGATRYAEISKALGRPAPVPSIFIDGELVYDQTPDPEALKEHLEQMLHKP